MTLKQTAQTLQDLTEKLNFTASVDMNPDYLEFNVSLPSGAHQSFDATSDTVAKAQPYEILWDLADAMVNFSENTDDHLWYADEAANPRIYADVTTGINQSDAAWLNALGDKVRAASNDF